ncbi:MAG: hypothetical protein ACYDHW_16890 [Syntrophorhabdaceae bacterium]
MAFLLILADELQVWERPTFLALKGGSSGPISVDVHVPAITPESIRLDFEINTEGNSTPFESEIKKYVFVFLQKWHKWFRSALGTSTRTFDLTLTFQSKINGETNYVFKSTRNKQPELQINEEVIELKQIWQI